MTHYKGHPGYHGPSAHRTNAVTAINCPASDLESSTARPLYGVHPSTTIIQNDPRNGPTYQAHDFLPGPGLDAYHRTFPAAGVDLNLTTASAPTLGLNVGSSSASSPANNGSRVDCPFQGCGKSFTRKGDLSRHAKKHDPEARTFHCYVQGCGFNGDRGFYRRDKLMDHERKAHGMHRN